MQEKEEAQKHASTQESHIQSKIEWDIGSANIVDLKSEKDELHKEIENLKQSGANLQRQGTEEVAKLLAEQNKLTHGKTIFKIHSIPNSI